VEESEVAEEAEEEKDGVRLAEREEEARGGRVTEVGALKEPREVGMDEDGVEDGAEDGADDDWVAG